MGLVPQKLGSPKVLGMSKGVPKPPQEGNFGISISGFGWIWGILQVTVFVRQSWFIGTCTLW